MRCRLVCLRRLEHDVDSGRRCAGFAGYAGAGEFTEARRKSKVQLVRAIIEGQPPDPSRLLRSGSLSADKCAPVLLELDSDFVRIPAVTVSSM